jgi:hypothetical protein
MTDKFQWTEVRSQIHHCRIFCTVFETVCASSFAMCAYQIGEHLHLTFPDHLNLYSQQANPNILSVSASALTNGEETTDFIISMNVLRPLECNEQIKYAF